MIAKLLQSFAPLSLSYYPCHVPLTHRIDRQFEWHLRQLKTFNPRGDTSWYWFYNLQIRIDNQNNCLAIYCFPRWRPHQHSSFETNNHTGIKLWAPDCLLIIRSVGMFHFDSWRKIKRFCCFCSTPILRRNIASRLMTSKNYSFLNSLNYFVLLFKGGGNR